MFNYDFTDFENQDCNGWVAEAGWPLQIVRAPASGGNDYRFSELSVSRGDLDDE